MEKQEYGHNNALTRIVYPVHGINVVNLGAIYGIEINVPSVTITMTRTSDSAESRAATEKAFTAEPQLHYLGPPELIIG